MNERTQQMYEWIINNPNGSELEIARGVGLKKSPYTRTILLYLWREGYVIRWLDDSGVRPTYRYYVQQTERMEGI